MATITLLELRTRARTWANMENSNFVTDAQLNAFINESYRAFYDLIVSRFDDYNVGDPTEFTVAAGLDYGTIGSGVYKIMGLDRRNGGDWVSIDDRYQWRDRNQRVYKMSGTDARWRYRLVGNKIYIKPSSQASGTYRYWSVPYPSTLTDNTDEIEGYNGFEIYIIIDAAIKMLNKEESDISYLMAERQLVKDRILQMALNRDAANADVIEDVNEYALDDYDRGYF